MKYVTTLAVAVAAAATLGAPAAGAAPAAATPPMGWNPWNAFRTEVTEAKVLAVADKLKQSGLADAGYRYVNLDDGWWLKRQADGRIAVRTSMFPSAALADGETSLRPFVDRVHALGLKAGIYTDIGRNACSQAWDAKSPNLPVGTQAEREVGTYGFQTRDAALLLGEWGFDYVKVDACGLADYASDKPYVSRGTYRALGPVIARHHPEQSDVATVEGLYADLAKAMAKVRPLGDYVLSICAWGEARVADWARNYGNTWRTSPDIKASWSSMLHNFDSAARRPLYAGPGHWNDPDMLEIGIGQFDAAHPVEARAHLSLWAIISAPLILGADLTRMPQEIIDIVGRREVIAIDQDPAGHQGVTVARDGDTQVIVKTLGASGSKAVALVNRGNQRRSVAVTLARLNLDPAAKATVLDAWSGRERGVEGGRIAAELAPHETVLLVVRGSPRRAGAVYLSELPARVQVLADGAGALPASLRDAWVPAQADAAPSGEPLVLGGERIDDGLGVLAGARLAARLDGEFGHFRARAGAMDVAALGAQPETVTYRVLGDGKLLFERTVPGSASVDIDLEVAGVRTLELATQTPAGVPAVVAWARPELRR